MNRIVLLLMLPVIGHAQPSVPFVFNFGYTGEEACIFFHDAGDCYYFIGTSSSTESNLSDVYITKTDTLLQHIFTKTIGFYNVDEAADAIEHNGQFFILANRLNSVTGYDPMVLCVNDNGDLVWQTNLGFSNWEFGEKIKVYGGQLAVVGNQEDGVFYARLNTDGDVLAMAVLDDNNFNASDFVVSGLDIFFSGKDSDADTDIETPSVKRAEIGLWELSELWTSQITGRLNCIELRSDKLISAGRLFDDSLGEEAFFALEISQADGAETFSQVYPAAGEITDCLVGADRYIYLAYNSTFALAENDIYVFQTNFVGQYAGAKYFDGAGNELSSNLLTDTSGVFVLLGSSNAFSRPDYNSHAIFTDEIPLGVSAPFNPESLFFNDSSLDISNNELNRFKVYPNPSGGVVQFETGLKNINVINNFGQSLFEESNITSRSLDLSGLPPGMYCVRGRSADDRLVFAKVVISH